MIKTNLVTSNALKLTYSDVEIQNFPGGETPGPPLQGRPRPRRGASNAGGGKGRGGEEPIQAPQCKFLATPLMAAGNIIHTLDKC